jgi:hypothetical protein
MKSADFPKTEKETGNGAGRRPARPVLEASVERFDGRRLVFLYIEDGVQLGDLQ